MIKKIVIVVSIFLINSVINAQQKDIAISDLPIEVKTVLDEYITILTTSDSIDDCANRFLEIAGGGLVNPNGTLLRNSVKPYSLKKDFNNIKFYKVPVEIIRVAKTKTAQAGYGVSALSGDWYKIYIAKKEGVSGMPAPVHIVFPINHAYIKTPKIIQGGSF